MDRGMKVRRGLALLTASLIFFHTPLAAAAVESGSPDEIIQEDAHTARTAEKEQSASAGLNFQWMNQVPKAETSYTAGNGQIVWTPKLDGEDVVSGTLTLKNAVINSAKIGICICVPVDIRVEGENQITAGSIGICALSSEGAAPNIDVALSGTGTLKINSQSGGIQASGNITADTVRMEIVYGSVSNPCRGIGATGGNIVLRNSKYIKVRSNTAGIGGESSAIFAGQSQGRKIRIENSHVIAINGNGPAINAPTGNIEFVSSDVRAVGNTNSGLASGTLYSQGCTINGGTLFADNEGGDYMIPSVSAWPLKASNNAVLFDGKKYVIPHEGDLVWYLLCSYDEDTDKVTVADRVIDSGDEKLAAGYVFGNVVWNENMKLGVRKLITIGYQDSPATLTIPKGTVLNMSEGDCFNVGGIQKQPKSKLINNGTIHVQSGASIDICPNASVVNAGTIDVQSGGYIYNYYDPSTKMGGLLQNNGSVTISQGGQLQNQGQLKNSGTIDAAGSSFYAVKIRDGSVINEGIINGFIVEMHNKLYVYAASGETALKNKQMLTLKPALGSASAMKLNVLEGARLVVEEGAVIDAKTHLTKETLADFIDLNDTIVVNGILLLPEDVTEEMMAEISGHIAGTGTVRFGDVIKYIVTVDKGDSAEAHLLADGEKIVLPQAPEREGYQFDGWYIKKADAWEPFDMEMEFHESAQIVSKWTKLQEEKPEEPAKPQPEQPAKPQPEQPAKPQPEQQPEQVKKPNKPQKQPVISKADIAANTVRLNQKAKASMSGTKLKVSWGKVSKASGYAIYAEKCGKKYKLVKTLKGSAKTSLAISKIGKKKISKKGTYKIQIQAYRIVNGKKKTIAKSLSLHVVGNNKKGYTNAKSIKVSKTKLTVKKGKTQKIKAKTVKQSKRKKLLPKKHIAVYRYYSTNEKVASVSNTGTVRGKKKGSCTVYVVSANGVKRGIKVTVK